MRDELTQDQLNRIFYGDPPLIEAEFYKTEILDVSESKKQGKRVTKEATYIFTLCRKEQTEFRRPAQEKDKSMYKDAWKRFEENENVRHREISEDCEEVGYLAAIRG